MRVRGENSSADDGHIRDNGQRQLNHNTARQTHDSVVRRLFHRQKMRHIFFCRFVEHIRPNRIISSCIQNAKNQDSEYTSETRRVRTIHYTSGSMQCRLMASIVPDVPCIRKHGVGDGVGTYSSKTGKFLSFHSCGHG